MHTAVYKRCSRPRRSRRQFHACNSSAGCVPAVLDVWGTGQSLENTADVLINPNLAVPPRPTISNMQWISGTQHVTPEDLDLLVGGPDRPPSKRLVGGASSSSAAGGGSSAGTNARITRAQQEQEGWGDYLTRQLNERAEKLNIMNDTMDSAAESSARWADSAGKYLNQQKRKMIFGSITGKFM